MPDKTLSGMIAAGELDCVIIARPPNWFREKHPDVVRLFPDYQAMEEEYYEDTNVYPIMHVIALRKAMLDDHPWVARNLYNAFEESKRRSLERILDPAMSRYPVPWLTNYATRMRRDVRRLLSLRHRGQPADARTVPALYLRAGHRAQARQAGRYFPRRHHGVSKNLNTLYFSARLAASARMSGAVILAKSIASFRLPAFNNSFCIQASLSIGRLIAGSTKPCMIVSS